MENAHVNLYTAIHKYLRQQFFTTLHAVGTVDEFDPDSTAYALRSARELLEFCRSHMAHEDRFIHAAIRRRRPSVHLSSDSDHRDHEHRIAALCERLDKVEQMPTAFTPQLWLDLYRDLALFIGENLDHMHVEETLIFQLLCDLFSPQELANLHAELVASIPPAEMQALLAPMLAAQSASEQLAMLATSQQRMSSDAFRSLMHSLSLLLPTERFMLLQRDLAPQGVALAV